MSPDSGCLFIVATPIGNLKDITFRAVETLKEAGLIAAEDTRRTRKLLSHLGLKKKIISCNEHNETKKASLIMEHLQKGESVALVSDAGTPGLSDPGARLVDKVREEYFRVIPIPGPSALTAALSVSGFAGKSFYFAGFLPAKPGERVKALEKLASIETVIVFFEAPHRLIKSLGDILKVLGDRKAFLAREMTKAHETYLSASVSRLMEVLEGKEVKGEITLVVDARSPEKQAPMDQERLKNVLSCLLRGKRLPVKEASMLLSGLTGIKRSRIYSLALEINREQKDA